MSQWQKWFACLLFVAVVSLVLLHLRVTAGQTESDAENLKRQQNELLRPRGQNLLLSTPHLQSKSLKTRE